MREKARILKHDADAPFPGRNEDGALAIEEGLTRDGDAPDLRAKESRNRREHGRFARSRRAKQGGHARGFAKLERRIQRESAETMPQRHPGFHCPMRVRVRRATNSARTRPASASMTESAARRAAAASPPGA